MSSSNMEYILLFACGFLLVGFSFQRDDRLSILKDATIARLARRGGGKLKLDADYVGPLGGKMRGAILAESSANGDRGRLRLSGEYSGLLGEAAGRIRADRRKGLGVSSRRLDVEGAMRGILGGAIDGHLFSEGKEGLRRFGGVGIRRKLDAGISASRPSGAAVGGRAKFSGGLDAGLAGVAGEVRGGLEGGYRGPLGVGASGGFDGGFHGSAGLPIVTGGHLIGGSGIRGGPSVIRGTRVIRHSRPARVRPSRPVVVHRGYTGGYPGGYPGYYRD